MKKIPYGIIDYKKLLEEKVNEATRQLENYMEDERIHKEVLSKFVVVFVGREAKLIEEV